jgi:hypothetical protein
MNIASIVIIAAIVILSVVAVMTSEEPLDELFHVDAAMNGFPLQPLATKLAQKPDCARLSESANDAEPAKGPLADNDGNRKLNRLVPQSTISC